MLGSVNLKFAGDIMDNTAVCNMPEHLPSQTGLKSCVWFDTTLCLVLQCICSENSFNTGLSSVCHCRPVIRYHFLSSCCVQK